MANDIKNERIQDNQLNYIRKPHTPSPLKAKPVYPEGLPDGFCAVPQETWEWAIRICKSHETGLAELKQMAENLIEQQDAKGPDWQHQTQRKVGGLAKPAAIRAEMAALYRESYAAGPDGARFFTRLMYMLDCLMRGAQMSEKTQQKAVQLPPKSRKKRAKNNAATQ